MRPPYIYKSTRLLILLMFTSLMTFTGFTEVPAAGRYKQEVPQDHHAVSVSAVPVQARLSDPKELEVFIDGVMADQMKAQHIPGAVVSVVKDGQLIFRKGYGYSDFERKILVDPERTLFRVGSVSKLFVWTVVMQLVEQARLNLDADVNTYLDFQIPATYPQGITMKNLMAHTAGFEGSDQGLLKKHPEELITLEQYVKTYIPARVFPPGKIEAYSNYGAALAGYIVERLSGMSFNDYIETNLFTPLGMTRSTFQQPLPADLASDLSNGYYFAQGQYVKAGFEYIVPYPIGSLSSTGADMARFMLAHLQNGQLGGNCILAEKTAQQMHSQLFTHDSRITGMAYGFYENRINGQRVLSHGGGTNIFFSKLYLIPDQKIGIFISTNAPGGAITRVVLFQKFMDHYYPVASSPGPAPAANFTSRVAPYLGTYYQASNNFTTVEKLFKALLQLDLSLDANGNLLARSGSRSIQLVEVEPGLLGSWNDANLELVMYTDENGQAYLLTPEPSPWMKAPWYGTTSFLVLLIGLGLLLFTGTLAGWTIAALIKVRQRQPSPLLSRLGRWTGVSFAIMLVIFLAGWAFLLLDTDPAYATQEIAFGPTPLFYALHGLAYILVGLGTLMLVFASLGWARCLGSLAGRLHYSLLALSALSLIWALWYWNLL